MLVVCVIIPFRYVLVLSEVSNWSRAYNKQFKRNKNSWLLFVPHKIIANHFCPLNVGVIWSPRMNFNRYKASFPSQTAGHEFFDSTTWIIYGHFFALIVMLLSHYFMYYVSADELLFSSDLVIVSRINLLGLIVLFILKLIAQHHYVIGLYMSYLCSIVASFIAFLGLYFWISSHAPIAFLSGLLYFGVAGYLLKKDYESLSNKTI